MSVIYYWFGGEFTKSFGEADGFLLVFVDLESPREIPILKC